MALGIKTTTSAQVGDILWADADVEVNDISYIDQVVFTAKKGDDLGEITLITSSHYEVENNYYISKSAKVHPMANQDFDYKPVSATDTAGGTSGGGFWSILGNLLGFGTEVLKKTNSTADTIPKDTTGTGGTDTKNNNAAGDTPQSSSTMYLYIGAAVLLLILLLVIFWKPKPSTPQPTAPTTDAPQVIKLT